jgi:hypothetical protein
MASVTEDSLNLAAHQIVAEFIDDSVDLNTGVRKKASDLGLNREQTARLIERTNSEAFLKVFPDKTDFAVADPSVVLSSSEKVASAGSVNKTTYAGYLNRDPYDIFGVANEKTASYDTSGSTSARGKLLDMVYSRSIEEACRVEKTAKLMEIEAAQANLWQIFKTAAYSGTRVGDMEVELLLAFPDKPFEVIDMVDSMTEKLASSLLAPEIMERAQAENFEPNEVVLESPIIRAFREVMDVV